MFWKRKPAETAPEPTPAAPKPRFTDMLVARSRAHGKASVPEVFAPAQMPPSVAQPKLAMDTAGDQGWAQAQFATAMASGLVAEGVVFPGFAVLAELAQRPEYRVIFEVIASEMTRKWIRLTTDDDADGKADKVKELSAELERLRLREVVYNALKDDGAFGRGHIYVDTGDADNPEELRSSIGDGWGPISAQKIGRGKIRALRAIEPVWCYPINYNSTDPLAADWYKPSTWTVMTKQIHSTRLVTIIGREVPDLLKPSYAFGGLSLSQMVRPYVDNWLETRQAVNDIISSFTTWVLKTDMGALTQSDGDALFRRVEAFNALRTNLGTMVVDKESEEFANVAASLAGLDHLQAQAQEHMAAVSRIPLVKLTGISPSGLNASSEGEIRVFYDTIKSMQEGYLRTPLHTLIGMVMLSLWGEVDESIGFEFEDLWELSEDAAANAEKTRADTDAVLIDSGVISPEEARHRLASDQNGAYASISAEPESDDLDEIAKLIGGLEDGAEDPEAEADEDPAGSAPEPRD